MSAPDLRTNFPHMVWRPMPHSRGVLIGSDFTDYPDDHPVLGLYKNCGSVALEEAGILYECALRSSRNHPWLEIGSYVGFSTSYIAAADRSVVAVDNMFPIPEFLSRFMENTKPFESEILVRAERSDEFFATLDEYSAMNWRLAGAFIDGDHNRPRPMEDALNCARYAANNAVLVFHDALGHPVQEAVLALIAAGWKFKWRDTVHGMAICYRGSFVPPDFTPDPSIDWAAVRLQSLLPDLLFAS